MPEGLLLSKLENGEYDKKEHLDAIQNCLDGYPNFDPLEVLSVALLSLLSMQE